MERNGTHSRSATGSPDCKPVLILKHVPWEGPHRIVRALGDRPAKVVAPLAGDPLPRHNDVAGVIAMGGPMNADETERYPELAAERRWLAEAVERELPVLGICLGAQLLARALGARVISGGRLEMGFEPISVWDPSDPIVGALAPQATVLHWHGDVFELPDGAQGLASSERTEHQAFRAGNAWGLLFHPEADSALIDLWLSVPQMAGEAKRFLGADAPRALRDQAQRFEDDLIARSERGFTAFAELLRNRAGQLV